MKTQKQACKFLIGCLILSFSFFSAGCSKRTNNLILSSVPSADPVVLAKVSPNHGTEISSHHTQSENANDNAAFNRDEKECVENPTDSLQAVGYGGGALGLERAANVASGYYAKLTDTMGTAWQSGWWYWDGKTAVLSVVWVSADKKWVSVVCVGCSQYQAANTVGFNGTVTFYAALSDACM